MENIKNIIIKNIRNDLYFSFDDKRGIAYIPIKQIKSIYIATQGIDTDEIVIISDKIEITIRLKDASSSFERLLDILLFLETREEEITLTKVIGVAVTAICN